MLETTVVKSVWEQLPVAAVQIVMVILFLREMAAARNQNQQMLSAFLTALSEQQQKNAAAQNEQMQTFLVALKEQRAEHSRSLNEIAKSFTDLVQMVNNRLAEMGRAIAFRAAEVKRRKNEEQ